MTTPFPSVPDEILRDRIRGGLYGLLLGDACGVPVEFTSPQERQRDPVMGMRGYGTHSQPPGHWSDDGALTLAHVAAFLDSSGWDPPAHMSEFRAWYEKARHTAGGTVFDIGESTARAILRNFGGTPWFACGCKGVYDNGNGSLMRILPVALRAMHLEPDQRAEVLAEGSVLTHAHRRSQLACILFGEICLSLLHDQEIGDAFTRTQGFHAEPEWQPYAHLPLPLGDAKPKSTGYVVDCLESALWCIQKKSDFRAAVLQAVNLGGDTDTTAAVCGVMAGLRCGYSGLPEDWLQVLPRQDYLQDLIDEFASLCLSNDFKNLSFRKGNER